ncbi:MAG TPA: DUF1080 domain-containing protein, partial [Sedimentisphaerales bacterium]|nr:DUF1080 domain-containing protein [Sedimentisphaerales bacterium]
PPQSAARPSDTHDQCQHLDQNAPVTDPQSNPSQRLTRPCLCNVRVYTKSDYGNFVLRLEWRWPSGKEPGKGGVLIRMTGEHGIWPRSLEAQLNADNAGDFWGLAGYSLSGPAERMQSADHKEFGRLTNLKKTRALEKPPGEWNTYEIIASRDTVTLVINGEEVNRATGCDRKPGRICLTSEGSEIHFRNLVITPAETF